MRYALFVGRWLPFHDGHRWLVEQKLNQGVPVLIAVRPTGEQDPEITVADIKAKVPKAEVFVLPVDIESVNYGRGVGYEVNYWEPPEDVRQISGTAIREGRHMEPVGNAGDNSAGVDCDGIDRGGLGVRLG